MRDFVQRRAALRLKREWQIRCATTDARREDAPRPGLGPA